MSCTTSINLTIPDAFKQQATMQHVDGARGNKMSFANFKTSRIHRGLHTATDDNEKARFHYTLTDGQSTVEVHASELMTRIKIDYEAPVNLRIFDRFSEVQQYSYVFSAIITGDTTRDGKTWELLMTNMYERGFARPDYNGMAISAGDTIFIKQINIKKTQLPNGKMGVIPFELLSGYELSTNDGVIAIIDMIHWNIWFYNELDADEKLNISGIATAIFARRVRDEKW